MTEFLAMGGYGAFIWPAYGLTAVVLGGLAVVSIRGVRQREMLVESLRRTRGQPQEEPRA